MQLLESRLPKRMLRLNSMSRRRFSEVSNRLRSSLTVTFTVTPLVTQSTVSFTNMRTLM
jgi:hypothetical protein